MQVVSTPNPTLDTYYAALANYGALGVTHEQGIRSAFRSLLETCAKSAEPSGWTLVEEHRLTGTRKRPDATLLDNFQIPRGYWEAKDTKDDLEAEIHSKIKAGYSLSNIIFEDTRRAVLYQNKQRVLEVDLTQRDAVAELLTRYFNHTPAEIEEFHRAEEKFREQIPILAKALVAIIKVAQEDNPPFIASFSEFFELCRTSLNSQVSRAQVEEMLVQHLLTERLFRNVFDNPEFTHRNVIAGEIEKVIKALTSQAFSREAFLKRLDYFYTAIENTAKTITDFSEKQGFLNTIYERFFQNFSTATADTHGIVYTPQPIVDFMCESVNEVLKTEFGKSLSEEGVTILDPCTGTGNFLVNILRRIEPLDLKRKYQKELFANEVMLLPYYVASLNIEHAYFDLQEQYEVFPGLCFVDTLELAQGKQLAMFEEANTERVKQEQDAAITVVIGNPPYNVGQQNENDNNKNRKYAVVDSRIRESYAKDSKATWSAKLYDAYTKFFRWSTDRLGDKDGVICFVTNNNFLSGIAFDGFRKHLARDFTQVYHLDLGGNARKSGSGNVFGIMVGVGITILVRNRKEEPQPYKLGEILYHALPEDMTSQEKLAFLTERNDVSAIEWATLEPDTRFSWLTEGLQQDYDTFVPIATKEAKGSADNDNAKAIFKNYSLGVATNRDEWVYDFSRKELIRKMKTFVTNYNIEVARWSKSKLPASQAGVFVNSNQSFLKWTDRLKDHLTKYHKLDYDESAIRNCVYRPFCRQFLYFDHLLNQRRYQQHRFFPVPKSEEENTSVCLSAIGATREFQCLASNVIPDLHFAGDTQCFPFYTYSVSGTFRRDNITNWALEQFQVKYGPGVTKRDIFHYVYGLLHSPQYRKRYKENLKRELPRIPLVDGPDAYQAFVDAGAKLTALHVGYEQAEEYDLKQKRNKDVPFSWRVTKMRLKGTSVIVNEALTLEGVPAEAFDYKLGSRSALEWVLDQYQVSTDTRSGIVTDPNRADDKEYIVRLVRKVVTVSVETARIVAGLPTVVNELNAITPSASP